MQTFKLGNMKWKILPSENTLDMGRCETNECEIYISTKFDEQNQQLTFHHELTHAILYTMGSELYDNEQFVNTFSTFLAQALTTLKDDK